GVQPQNVFVNNDISHTYTFSVGAITTTGSLIKQGPGTLVLANDNTYANVTLSGGTIQIGNGGTSGSLNGDITNSGLLAFNRSGNLTYTGVISGTGAVSVAGGLNLTLTGVNTYTGATSIAAGSTLILGGTSGTLAIGTAITNSGTLSLARSM